MYYITLFNLYNVNKYLISNSPVNFWHLNTEIPHNRRQMGWKVLPQWPEYEYKPAWAQVSDNILKWLVQNS
jgi:hypothetical protein